MCHHTTEECMQYLHIEWIIREPKDCGELKAFLMAGHFN